jgi:hypothetical protein
LNYVILFLNKNQNLMKINHPPEMTDKLVPLMAAEGALRAAPSVDALVAAFTIVGLSAGAIVLATCAAHKPLLPSVP